VLKGVGRRCRLALSSEYAGDAQITRRSAAILRASSPESRMRPMRMTTSRPPFTMSTMRSSVSSEDFFSASRVLRMADLVGAKPVQGRADPAAWIAAVLAGSANRIAAPFDVANLVRAKPADRCANPATGIATVFVGSTNSILAALPTARRPLNGSRLNAVFCQPSPKTETPTLSVAGAIAMSSVG